MRFKGTKNSPSTNRKYKNLLIDAMLDPQNKFLQNKSGNMKLYNHS